jgi:hypothetical protein
LSRQPQGMTRRYYEHAKNNVNSQEQCGAHVSTMQPNGNSDKLLGVVKPLDPCSRC